VRYRTLKSSKAALQSYRVMLCRGHQNLETWSCLGGEHHPSSRSENLVMSCWGEGRGRGANPSSRSGNFTVSASPRRGCRIELGSPHPARMFFMSLLLASLAVIEAKSEIEHQYLQGGFCRQKQKHPHRSTDSKIGPGGRKPGRETQGKLPNTKNTVLPAGLVHKATRKPRETQGPCPDLKGFCISALTIFMTRIGT
jgi:hypothetical protein